MARKTAKSRSKRGDRSSVTTSGDDKEGIFPLLLPAVKEESRETSGECLLRAESLEGSEEGEKAPGEGEAVRDTSMSNYGGPRVEVPRGHGHKCVCWSLGRSPEAWEDRAASERSSCGHPRRTAVLERGLRHGRASLKTPYDDHLFLRQELFLGYSPSREERDLARGLCKEKNLAPGLCKERDLARGHFGEENPAFGHFGEENGALGLCKEKNRARGHFGEENPAFGHFGEENGALGLCKEKNRAPGLCKEKNLALGHFGEKNFALGHFGEENRALGHFGEKNLALGVFGEENIASGAYEKDYSVPGNSQRDDLAPWHYQKQAYVIPGPREAAPSWEDSPGLDHKALAGLSLEGDRHYYPSFITPLQKINFKDRNPSANKETALHINGNLSNLFGDNSDSEGSDHSSPEEDTHSSSSSNIPLL